MLSTCGQDNRAMSPAAALADDPLPMREACVQAAREAIAEQGLEKLSLREVARRLGVSHQAPYKHFPSRDHLLAEVLKRCYEAFADALEAREKFEDPQADLESLGRAYMRYAGSNPLEYRLMFGNDWPKAAEYAEMYRSGLRAFDVLRATLRRVYGKGVPKAKLDADAMFIWSTIHGLVSILQVKCCEHLDLAAKVEAGLADHHLTMISAALRGAEAPGGTG
jgi:AcrR family transcriptional regulator